MILLHVTWYVKSSNQHTSTYVQRIHMYVYVASISSMHNTTLYVYNYISQQKKIPTRKLVEYRIERQRWCTKHGN